MVRYLPVTWITKPDLTNAFARLRIPYLEAARKLKNPRSAEGRLDKLKQTVTALVKYERIELNYNRADESRAYAELLISEAIRQGPKSNEMMELADWWLVEKQLVHKLFKVLVPRFQSSPVSYTKLYHAPTWTFTNGFHPQADRHQYSRDLTEPDPLDRLVRYKKAVLELKGHPYPPLFISVSQNPSLLHNVLLSAAKSEFRAARGKHGQGRLSVSESMREEASEDLKDVKPQETTESSSSKSVSS